MKILCKNKKALFDYEILDEHEAGMVLLGPEVKSLRAGMGNLKGSHLVIQNGEMFAHNIHISPYKFALQALGPFRERKILLKKKTLLKLEQKLKETGFTLIPTQIYLKGSLIKITVALAKGRKKHDKRQVLKERDQKREIQKSMRQF